MWRQSLKSLPYQGIFRLTSAIKPPNSLNIQKDTSRNLFTLKLKKKPRFCLEVAFWIRCHDSKILDSSFQFQYRLLLTHVKLIRIVSALLTYYSIVQYSNVIEKKPLQYYLPVLNNVGSTWDSSSSTCSAATFGPSGTLAFCCFLGS